jgi:hypothetical protein
MARSLSTTSMDLEYEILKEHSKRQIARIGKWIGSDCNRFTALMELFLHGEYRVTQRSAWAISYCIEHHPELLEGWIPAMVKKMREEGVHDAVPRNVLRILKNADIPRSQLGIIVTVCFNYLLDASIPIAIKANAMYILGNAAEKEPGLIHEIEETLLHIPNASAGIKACAAKVLKQIHLVRRNRGGT